MPASEKNERKSARRSLRTQKRRSTSGEERKTASRCSRARAHRRYTCGDVAGKGGTKKKYGRSEEMQHQAGTGFERRDQSKKPERADGPTRWQSARGARQVEESEQGEETLRARRLGRTRRTRRGNPREVRQAEQGRLEKGRGAGPLGERKKAWSAPLERVDVLKREKTAPVRKMTRGK